ncbi:MAG: proton-dependent oligopeptide transporter family [Amycolatopsis sp.]|uniref:peptide MFS transporter n=1 Tax=Amycolatopsis sp. TaxID=37632 RepID=UPI0026278D68|nr:peptide MFS transporter [Amycolatopsis sp.]MCU1684981.1 proton-dependent oligopeptide transporter family [Amycolatopsis sp.]
MSTSTEVKRDKGFFGHPRALANLFGVEMWERFSFYGMLGILPLYLYYASAQGGLDMPKATAVSIVGAYGGLVYLSTIVGAWIADRLLGSERTLFYSAVVIMIGHISLALLPGYVGIGVGLACISLGSGGLKGNATAVVGTLYAEQDERRDAGFTIFYMGINLGGFAGPLLTGLAQQKVNFHLGFGLAAIGMALGLVQYTLGRKNLGAKASEVINPLPASKRLRFIGLGVAIVVAIVLLVVTGVITAANLSDVTVWVVVVAAIIYFAVILTSKKITKIERSRVFSFIPMFIASAAFWALYQQQFTVVTVYSDQRLDRSLFGWQFPVSWVQSINPVFLIVFAPILALLWTKLGPRQPSTPIKFALGTGLMGIAFLLFLPTANGGAHDSPLLALAGVLFVFTIAELCISPVGLSLATKLAPKVFRTQMVAVNFLAISLGTALSGSLAKHYDPANEVPYFGIIGSVAIVIAIVLAALSPLIRKLMAGVR